MILLTLCLYVVGMCDSTVAGGNTRSACVYLGRVWYSVSSCSTGWDSGFILVGHLLLVDQSIRVEKRISEALSVFTRASISHVLKAINGHTNTSYDILPLSKPIKISIHKRCTCGKKTKSRIKCINSVFKYIR